jgi:hypothetical protein
MVAARILKMVARLIHGERKRHREREREAVWLMRGWCWWWCEDV